MDALKTVLLTSSLAISPALYAGVEMDLITRDAGGKTTQAMKVYAQSGKIRMEDSGESTGREMTMIFLDDEFVVVDHAEKSYVVMDDAMLAEMGTRIDDAMKQMEAQLEGMPPEQRAMIEQMMKGQMESMAGSKDESPPLRIEKIGMDEWQSEPCTQFAVYEGRELAQEVCSADLSAVDGAGEAKQAFESMARFLTKMTDSMPEFIAGSMSETPMALVDQIEGFPVRTTHYVDGEVSLETTLESVTEKDIDAGLFTAPDGYTRQDPFAGQ